MARAPGAAKRRSRPTLCRAGLWWESALMNAPFPHLLSASARSPEPNTKAIREHLEWLTAPARGAYDDALIEIAYDHNGDQNPSRAKLFGLDQLEDAVRLAARQNA